MRAIPFILLTLIVPSFASAIAPPRAAYDATYEAGGIDLAEGVALAADGSAYVVGTAQRPGGDDMVTLKVDPQGKAAWTRVVQVADKDRGADAVAIADGVVAAGTITAQDGVNAILTKYSASGDPAWSTTFDKGTAETARALAADASGNVFLTGGTLGSNGGDCFLAKFSSNGQEIWAKPVNLFWLDECFDVATDASGNAIVVGRVVRDGSFDVLVRKFSPSGSVVWTEMISTPAREEGRGIAADPAGSIYVSGTTSVVRDGVAQSDILLAKLSAGGDVVWSRTIDVGGGDDEGRGVAYAGGGLYLTGFGPVNGEKQSVVVKLTPAGDEVWRHVSQRAGTDGTGSIAASADGSRVVVAGAASDGPSDFDFLLLSYAPGRPSAAFTLGADAASLQAGAPIQFEDASTQGQMRIVERRWDFGDGSSSTDQNPTHTYASAGQYRVQLTVWDEWRTAHIAERLLSVLAGTAPGASVSPTAGGATSPTGGATNPTEQESKTPAPALGASLVALALVAWLARGRR